ncbi:metallophosphoesterase family protein, partial [Romboutsia sp.]|uniref:metallophosphoesterase family protein n=1 Tax=Romboutsia sp. TaxID=1965302 RepID=UPI003F314034
MKFLYLTDTHITAKNPSSRTDTISDTIKQKMKEIGVVIQKEHISAVIHGGDMFHHPEVSNKFVGEIAQIIRSYDIPFYVVPGNHDVQGQNEESLPHSKLGLLASSGVINILDRKNPVMFAENGYKITFEGQEYYPDIDKNPITDYAVNMTGSNFKVLVAHSMLLENKFFDGVAHTLIKDVQTDADLILSGHYHPGFKTQEVNNTLFMNPGSLLRMDSSTHSITQKPKVLILDISSNGFIHQEYELQIAKEGKDVFSTKNLDKKIYSNTLEGFNKKLKNIKLDDVNIVSLIDDYVTKHPEDLEIVKKAK